MASRSRAPLDGPRWIPACAGTTRGMHGGGVASPLPCWDLCTGSGGVPFPGSSGWTLRPMDSRLRGNDEGAAGMTVLLQRSRDGVYRARLRACREFSGRFVGRWA